MPKIVDHVQYRKELLGKCFDLFAEKGYAALTMRQIANGLGVSTGTLYHYFSSKEVLFEQMVREMTVQDIQQVVQVFQQKSTPLERVQAAFELIEAHEDYFMKQTLICLQFYQQQRQENGDRPALFTEIWREHEHYLNDLLGLGVTGQAGKTLFNFIGCFIDGLLMHRMFDPLNVNYQAQTQLFLKMLTLYLTDLDAHPPTETA